jgi:hypothetical protein
LIRNLKINLTSYDYKILISVLNMENWVEDYSMLLRWPWMKLAKAHHNWGDKYPHNYFRRTNCDVKYNKMN